MSFPVMILSAFACGLLAGGLGIYLFLRFRAGGRSVVQMRRELDSYREDVGSHFDRTSELFAELTEQYRALAEHLSSDARKLTGRDSVAMALEEAQGILPDQPVGGRLEKASEEATGETAEGAPDMPEEEDSSSPSVDGEPGATEQAGTGDTDDAEVLKETGMEGPVPRENATDTDSGETDSEEPVSGEPASEEADPPRSGNQAPAP